MAGGTVSVFAAAFRNRELRRLELAFAAFNGVEWGVWISLLVYAYGHGGAAAAGALALVQLLPSAVLAPLIGATCDRHRAGRMLLVGYLAIGLATAGIAAAVYLNASPVFVFLLAPIVNLGITFPRPAQSSLLPAVVRSPIELTAANVVSSWMENGSVLIAPALAGVLLGIRGPGLSLAVMAGLGLVAAALVVSIPGPPPLVQTDGAGVMRQVKESITVVRRDPPVRLLVGLLGSQYILVGAMDVLCVVMAISVLGMGEGGAGYLNSAFGAGGLIGGLVTVALVAHRRLAPSLIAGVLTAALALGVLGLAPSAIAAFALFGLAGLGRAIFDVTGRILLQRTAPPGVLAQVFALLETMMNLGLAAGCVLVPILVGLSGARAALLGTCLLFVLLVALTWRRLRAVDEAADVPQVEIQLLKSIPLFSPLSAPELEGLARALEPVSVEAGATVIREGDEGDQYYAIADGEVEVSSGGHPVARLRRGNGFGEIALIRDCCRTATVRACVPTHLYALEKDPFITAITGHAPVARAADEVIDNRLEELHACEEEFARAGPPPSPRI